MVGQVCVIGIQGAGILTNFMQASKNRFQSKYDFAITEIAVKDLGSQRAHQRIGFKEIHRYLAPDNVEWSIVLWDWNK